MHTVDWWNDAASDWGDGWEDGWTVVDEGGGWKTRKEPTLINDLPRMRVQVGYCFWIFFFEKILEENIISKI